jgi:hypothetical protein
MGFVRALAYGDKTQLGATLENPNQHGPEPTGVPSLYCMTRRILFAISFVINRVATSRSQRRHRACPKDGIAPEYV